MTDQELIKAVAEPYDQTESFKKTAADLHISTAKVRKAYMGKGMPGMQLLKSGYASGLFVCTPLGQHTVFIIDQNIPKIEGIACFRKFVFTK